MNKELTIAEQVKDRCRYRCFGDINLEISNIVATLDICHKAGSMTCDAWEDEAGNCGLEYGFEDGSSLSVSTTGKMEAKR